MKYFTLIITLFYFLVSLVHSQEKLTQVRVLKIKKKELVDKILYPGVLRPQEESHQVSPLDGIITNLYVRLGQLVKKNETIMEITPIDPGRMGGKWKVQSSIDGIISNLEVNQGAVVNSTKELSKVVNPHKLNIRLEMTGEDLPLLQKIKKAKFKIHNKEFPISVYAISPVLDTKTGTASVDFHFDSTDVSAEFNKFNKKRFLAIGSIGQVIIESNQHNAIEIPNDAISFNGKDYFVKTMDEKTHKVNQKIIKLGPKRNDKTEIQSGLKENELMIIFSSSYVSENEIVEIDKDN